MNIHPKRLSGYTSTMVHKKSNKQKKNKTKQKIKQNKTKNKTKQNKQKTKQKCVLKYIK